MPEAKIHTYACQSHNNLALVKALLDYGADVNVPSNGSTPLINAAAEGYPDLVQLLLDHGADVHLKDAAGHTALGVVKKNMKDPVFNTFSYRKIVQMLQVAGAKPAASATAP